MSSHLTRMDPATSLTKADFAIAKAKAAKLPFKWSVSRYENHPGLRDDPAQTIAMIEMTGDGPHGLPWFDLRRRDGTVELWAFRPDDYGSADDEDLGTFPTVEQAFGGIHAAISDTLSQWGVKVTKPVLEIA